MKQIKIYKYKDKVLEELWNKFYENNSIYPYSSREYSDIVYNCLKFRLSNYFKEHIFICYFDGDKFKVIAPIVINNNKLSILGANTQAGHLDFLYSNEVSEEDFENFFLLMKERYDGKRMFLERINEKSLLSKFLLKKISDKVKIVLTRPCVDISFGSDYQEYFNSLSKSNRQNIRTAYNKLTKDDKEYHLECLQGFSINKTIIKQQIGIYNKRALEQRAKRRSIITKFKQLYFNPITVACMRLDNAISFNFYINNRIAAFMIGFKTNFNSIVIPRLAIDSEFAKYMPGKLLINEAIKYLVAHSDIRNIDLSRGDEKYKYDMGGKTHYNYDFEIIL